MSSGVLYIIFSLGNGGTQRNIVNTINNIHLKNQRKVLFLYNATKSSDLENLIYEVKSKVLKKSGIDLELELQIIGEKL